MKVHVQVGDFDPRDPPLDEVWGVLADAGVPVVTHCGSGPAPGRFTGPGRFAEVLARHPSLTAVVAHMGMPEYAEFLDLADRYPRVHLDTTMAFTDFTETWMPFPPELRPRLLRPAGPDRARLRLPEHAPSLRAPGREPASASTSATRGCARCCTATPLRLLGNSQ